MKPTITDPNSLADVTKARLRRALEIKEATGCGMLKAFEQAQYEERYEGYNATEGRFNR